MSLFSFVGSAPPADAIGSPYELLGFDGTFPDVSRLLPPLPPLPPLSPSRYLGRKEYPLVTARSVLITEQ